MTSTTRSNASGGKDHGAAAPVFVFGDGVKPGIIGQNPTWPSKLTVNDNLALQYDFRTIYSTLLEKWFQTEVRSGPETDLTEIDIGSRFYVVDIEADVPERFIGLYRQLPMSRIDGPQNIFSIYIRHFNRVFSLDRPDAAGAIGREHPNMKGRSLQQSHSVNTGNTYEDQT